MSEREISHNNVDISSNITPTYSISGREISRCVTTRIKFFDHAETNIFFSFNNNDMLCSSCISL